jgi:hypothetical protein
MISIWTLKKPSFNKFTEKVKISKLKVHSMHLHLDHRVNQLTVQGQGAHALDDSEATYKDILMLHPAPTLQPNKRIQLYVDIG